MLFVTYGLQAYFLNIRQMASFTSVHCCKRVWKLSYTRLRTSSSIAATSSTMACLSYWIVMIRLRNTRSFRNPHRKKSGIVRSGDRAGQAMSPKLRTQVARCCTFQRSIATDHMKWRPLLYRSISCQPLQAIAPAQHSNLKFVSRLRATLYINKVWVHVLCYRLIHCDHLTVNAICHQILGTAFSLSGNIYFKSAFIHRLWTVTAIFVG